jgi:hypothetical protein
MQTERMTGETIAWEAHDWTLGRFRFIVYPMGYSARIVWPPHSPRFRRRCPSFVVTSPPAFPSHYLELMDCR